jgi:SAM-dependent methyltransferase
LNIGPVAIELIRTIGKGVIPRRYHAALLRAYFSVKLWWIPTLLYLGNSVSCPVCDGRFRAFRIVHAEQAVNARCPRCRASERHRMLWLYLRDRTNLFSDHLRFLHFAPEISFKRKLSLCANLRYVAVDLSTTGVTVSADAMLLPFRDGKFDAVLCSHVLEHVADDRRAMGEILRVLKPGGWAVLHVPIDSRRETTYEDPSIVEPEERARHFGQSDHVRWYGRDFQERLERAGFVVRREAFASGLGEAVVRRYRLMEDDDIYFCTKPGDEAAPSLDDWNAVGRNSIG